MDGFPDGGNGDAAAKRDRGGEGTSERCASTQAKKAKSMFLTPPAISGKAFSVPAKVRRVAVWFRRDLRLDDNPALIAACRAGVEVIPLFVWASEEEGIFSPGRSSRWWLEGSLEALSAQLSALGSRMVLFHAKTSKDALLPFVKQYNVDALFFNHLYDPISLVRDNKIRLELRKMGVHVESFGADLLYEPWEVFDADGKPFVGFEPFWDAIKRMNYEPLVPLPSPVALPLVHSTILGNVTRVSELGILEKDESLTCDHLRLNWQPGATHANALWQDFAFKRLPNFSTGKAKVDFSVTSKLSPFIHYGEISIRRMHYQLKKMRQECEARGVNEFASIDGFSKQLGYRDYSRYILFHNPFTHERPMLEHLRAVPWNYDQDLFKLWRQGCTGYPLIDAAMHELFSSGWCHNRLRVIVGHFMVKYLNLPWQWGLKYFWDTLIDADLESDTLGWQYLSGCMADAKPFSYIMDYRQECDKIDPQGAYVRKWIPLLSRLPRDFVHEPWRAPPVALRAAGVELGITYPHRVVHIDEVRRQVAEASRLIEQNRLEIRQGQAQEEQGAGARAEAGRGKDGVGGVEGGEGGRGGGGGSGAQQQHQPIHSGPFRHPTFSSCERPVGGETRTTGPSVSEQHTSKAGGKNAKEGAKEGRGAGGPKGSSDFGLGDVVSPMLGGRLVKGSATNMQAEAQQSYVSEAEGEGET